MKKANVVLEKKWPMCHDKHGSFKAAQKDGFDVCAREELNLG